MGTSEEPTYEIQAKPYDFSAKQATKTVISCFLKGLPSKFGKLTSIC